MLFIWYLSLRWSAQDVTTFSHSLLPNAESLDPSATRIWIFRNFRERAWFATSKKSEIYASFQKILGNLDIFETPVDVFSESACKKMVIRKIKFNISTYSTAIQSLSFRNIKIFPLPMFAWPRLSACLCQAQSQFQLQLGWANTPARNSRIFLIIRQYSLGESFPFYKIWGRVSLLSSPHTLLQFGMGKDFLLGRENVPCWGGEGFING